MTCFIKPMTRQRALDGSQEVPLYQECLHVTGDPEKGAPGGHVCRGLMGVTEHILQILQSECCHPQPLGVVLLQSSSTTPS